MTSEEAHAAGVQGVRRSDQVRRLRAVREMLAPSTTIHSGNLTCVMKPAVLPRASLYFLGHHEGTCSHRVLRSCSVRVPRTLMR